MPAAYKILSNILLSKLTPYAEEITGFNHCGFRRKRSATDHIFCIRPALWKTWEYNEVVNQTFIDFKKAYASVWREVLYTILTESGIPMKTVMLIRVRLNQIYSRVRIGKH